MKAVALLQFTLTGALVGLPTRVRRHHLRSRGANRALLVALALQKRRPRY
jgi:hypothetical protein